MHDARTASMLTLLGMAGIGRIVALRLIPVMDSARADGGPPDALLGALPGREGEAIEAWKAATALLDRCATLGLRVLVRGGPGYPDRLAGIPDPPAVLYVKGDATALQGDRAVAIVGTREPTDFGAKVARRCGASTARDGLVVVSGLAKGVDQAAHEGCVEAGGRGVAVMAHGLDDVQPRSASLLARRLVETGGCLVSEYPPGAEAERRRFVERDRIQSGLSDAVMIVEADLGSGTMHTARFAAAQGRPIACLSHPDRYAGIANARGNARLIAEGATPVEDGASLASFLTRAAPGPQSLERRTTEREYDEVTGRAPSPRL